MSDQTVTPAENANATAASDTTANAPKKARKQSQKANPLSGKSAFSVTDLARARLRKRGVRSDELLSDEKKVVRGILRRNFPAVRKQDAAVRKAKQEANDRKPWPTNMNRTTADLVVNGKGQK
jgi:hypothetical protein